MQARLIQAKGMRPYFNGKQDWASPKFKQNAALNVEMKKVL